ncbi:MAG: DUF5640 domain-containing protein [Verrucomicrobiales bacterium]
MKQIGKKLALAFAAFAMLMSCSEKESLVGKWQQYGAANGENATFEFFGDGKLSLTTKETTVSGRYSVLEGNSLKWEFEGRGQWIGPVIESISLSGDELSLTDSVSGKSRTYHRSK